MKIAMENSDDPLSKLLRRWTNQQEAALHQLSERKTMGQRFAGLRKSERVDAKFFLLAIVPFVPMIIWDHLDWERGIIWKGWASLSVVWAVIIVGIGSASYWRAVRKTFRRNP